MKYLFLKSYVFGALGAICIIHGSFSPFLSPLKTKCFETEDSGFQIPKMMKSKISWKGDCIG